jgi:hypothetical protein
MLVTATSAGIIYQFYNADGVLLDDYSVTKHCAVAPPTASPTLTPAPTETPTPTGIPTHTATPTLVATISPAATPEPDSS